MTVHRGRVGERAIILESEKRAREEADSQKLRAVHQEDVDEKLKVIACINEPTQ